MSIIIVVKFNLRQLWRDNQSNITYFSLSSHRIVLRVDVAYDLISNNNLWRISSIVVWLAMLIKLQIIWNGWESHFHWILKFPNDLSIFSKPSYHIEYLNSCFLTFILSHVKNQDSIYKDKSFVEIIFLNEKWKYSYITLLSHKLSIQQKLLKWG